jgi:hypothetical protein
MPYKAIISGDSTIELNSSIESIDFRIDTPNDVSSKSSDVDYTIEIHGKIGAGDSTIELYQWAMLPTSDSKTYRKVEIRVIGAHNGPLLRKVTFPNCFVVDYAESFNSYEGNGSFYLLLKQKKDKTEDIKIAGDMKVSEDEDK